MADPVNVIWFIPRGQSYIQSYINLIPILVLYSVKKTADSQIQQIRQIRSIWTIPTNSARMFTHNFLRRPIVVRLLIVSTKGFCGLMTLWL